MPQAAPSQDRFDIARKNAGFHDVDRSYATRRVAEDVFLPVGIAEAMR
ncbi:MAG: hypothetical protein M1415_11160 [Firmicutes bacterium]|nr:hypothetical protein [Bacillota bacterium]